jgi:uracil-DNA glycosylase
LFLLETPGRKAHGTAFISRDNPDPTARNLRDLMLEADIPRRKAVIWNIVPWYLGTETHIRAAGSADIRESLPYTLELLRLLPRLRVIVLVGKKAQSAAAPLRARTPLPFIETPHMSATNLNPRPEMRAVILTRFRHVADLLQPL